MTITQWLRTVSLLSFAYILGNITPPGEYWFAYAASVSALIVPIILIISLSPTSIILAILEVIAIGTIGLSWLNFTDLIVNGFWYNHHESVIYAIAISQIVILSIGMPNGTFKRLFEYMGLGDILLSANHFFGSGNLAQDK